MAEMAETWQLDVPRFDERMETMVRVLHERQETGDPSLFGRGALASQMLYMATCYRLRAERDRVAALAALDLLDSVAMLLGELDAEEGSFRRLRRAELLEAWA